MQLINPHYHNASGSMFLKMPSFVYDRRRNFQTNNIAAFFARVFRGIYSQSPSRSKFCRWSAVVRNTITDFWGGIAVPAFFIISGYLFFAKPKPIAKTIKAKLKGIVLPYVLWTLISIFSVFCCTKFFILKDVFCARAKPYPQLALS